jgi:hypothetical protein
MGSRVIPAEAGIQLCNPPSVSLDTGLPAFAEAKLRLRAGRRRYDVQLHLI